MRCIWFSVEIGGETTKERIGVEKDLVTYLAGKRPGFLRWIMVGTLHDGRVVPPQPAGLAETCCPLGVADGPGLAALLEDLRGDNPRIHDDLELVSRETHAFLRARGVRYRGTVEKWVD